MIFKWLIAMDNLFSYDLQDLIDMYSYTQKEETCLLVLTSLKTLMNESDVIGHPH